MAKTTNAAASQVNEASPTAPHRLDEIVTTFGDIHAHIAASGTLKSTWEVGFLARASLPFPLRLSWDSSRIIAQMTCHRRMTGVFSSVFCSIYIRGLQDRITTFGGCFAFRPQRTGTKLSTHSWGIAIDLNPESNPQGSKGNMDAVLIDIFRRAGFEWGGDWQGKTRDPMHFQFCTGY
jgi:D-alanyl-D-alanine carboxypeptidase